MGTQMGTDQDLIEVRTRWQELTRVDRPDALRVGLLASYTVDPLLPYLGVGLADAGLTASMEVGAFNQIVQQCLDDASPMALFEPDVLVVAPRLEELGEPADYRAELGQVVDIACAAAGRWRAYLVVVLPAIPEARAHGALDDGIPTAVPVAAVEAREEVRARLAGLPGVRVVDAEHALRMVGGRDAHHGALFRFARIPYTEPVFAELGAQVAGVLRAVFGATPRAVVLDADPLAGGIGEADARVLAEQLRLLHRSGARLGLRSSGGGDALWDTLAKRLPEFTADLLDAWVVDARPVREQVADVAAALGVPVDSTVLIGTGEQGGEQGAVRLSGPAESWPALLRGSGLLDRLPVPTVTDRPTRAVPAARGHSLADFVAGLGVEVDCEPVTPATAAKVAEVVSRAKDFTLGFDEVDLADREVFAIRVRDRFGDYGISGAFGVCRDTGVVDVFSLSCPVLGKGVPERVLAAIEGARRFLFRYRATAHNQVTAEFLASAELRTEEVR